LYGPRTRADSTDQLLAAAVLQRDRAERRRDLIAGIADGELPVATAVGAVAFIGYGIVDGIAHPADAAWRVPTAVLPGLLFATVWFLASRRRIPSASAPRVYAGLVVIALGATLLTVAVSNQPREFAHTAIILAATGAVIPSYALWAPVVGLTGVCYVFVLLNLDGDNHQVGHWLLVGAAAAVASFYVVLARRRVISALVDAERSVENMAVSDPLTGALNRNGLRMLGDEMLAIAQRQGTSVFSVFVDVDGLKEVNDTIGHDAGDRILRLVAEQLERTFRRGDLVARWGGDEFVVIGLGVRPDPTVLEERITEALLAEPERPPAWPGRLSTGVADIEATEAHIEVVDDLIGRADLDMYERRARRRSG
jgi:diguanylate cyclase